MHGISLFGAVPSLSAWFQLLPALSALAMLSASAQIPVPETRPVPVSVPLGCLFGLALASVMAGIMQPELLAAAFAQT